MSAIRMQSGGTEPVLFFAQDIQGAAVTGKTDLFVKVVRESDNWLLDWTSYPASTTFAASPAAALSPALAEMNATLAPGLYKLTGGLDLSIVTNMAAADELALFVVQTPGSDVIEPPPLAISVGGFTDDIVDVRTIDVTGLEAQPNTLGRVLDLLNKHVRGRLRLNPTLDQLELYDPVDDTLLLTWPMADFAGGGISNVAGAPFDRSKAVET